MIHSALLHNREIVKADAAALYAGQLGLLAGWGVFTTMRVKDGCLFAWERHWARLSRDARQLNVEMPPDADALQENLLRLVQVNGFPDCTMRLNIVRNGGGIWEDRSVFHQASDVIALTADSKKWGNGVRLTIKPNGRFAAGEFTRAKILSWAPNLTLAERAQTAGFDETILLNEHGRVAECTSANIFAVIGDQVITPPLSEGCLPGITREVLVNEIHVPIVQIREDILTVDDLRRASSVFITSSTRDLLAVREIDGESLGSDGVVQERLSAAFNKFLEADISSRKRVAMSAR